MKKIQNYLSKIQWKNILKILLSLVIVFLILFSTFSCLHTFPSYAAVDDTITLKAGTYRFNDFIVTNSSLNDDLTQYSLQFYYNNVQYNYLIITCIDYGSDIGVVTQITFAVSLNDDPISIYVEYANNETDNGYMVDTPVYITLETDQVCSELLGHDFIDNTNYNEVNGDDDVRMLIKAGRYQFNDTLFFSTSINENDYNNIHFTYNNSEYHGFRFISESSGSTDITTMTFLNGNNIADGTLIYAKQVLSDGSVSDTYNGYQVDTPVIIDIVVDQEVPIYIALEFLYNVQIIDSGGGTCPTLPELLNDYTGSFDSIVDMLNSKNYREYDEYIEYKYNQGYSAGASDDFVNGFFGNMLTGAVRAIDAIVIYRSGDFYISVWTVLTTVVITSLMLGLLKIWRGG